MKLFIDTGSVAEVEEIAAWGVLSGATTNPSLLAKEDGEPGDSIRRICELVDGPVSGEVVSDNARELVSNGIPVNMTLVFSAAQALLTAEAGASYVSCFMGRLDDISVNSESVVAEIVEALGPDRDAQVLAASIRSPMHVVTAARLGCEVATIPGKVLKAMLAHPLTESGIARFSDDWQSRPEFGQWLRGLVDDSAAAKR